jgi:L-aminopeptidase/D-esterase-like protein
MTSFSLNMDGFRVGHATDDEARTGCTVVLSEEGATGGVHVKGAAPASLETDALRPGRLTQTAHAILLSGGSAFGLHAAAGVQSYLEQRSAGFSTGSYHVPIVPAAAIYDLEVGDGSVRPGPNMAKTACENASNTCEIGRIGAAAGATIGKAFGPAHAQPGALGAAVTTLKRDVRVAAIVAVNCVGDLRDPADGNIIAGARDDQGRFMDGAERFRSLDEEEAPGFTRNNTIVGTILTNADLSCEQCCKLASSGFDGLARVVYPASTMSDGDLLFALASGHASAQLPADALLTGAADAVRTAILSPFQDRASG